MDVNRRAFLGTLAAVTVAPFCPAASGVSTSLCGADLSIASLEAAFAQLDLIPNPFLTDNEAWWLVPRPIDQ